MLVAVAVSEVLDPEDGGGALELLPEPVLDPEDEEASVGLEGLGGAGAAKLIRDWRLTSRGRSAGCSSSIRSAGDARRTIISTPWGDASRRRLIPSIRSAGWRSSIRSAGDARRTVISTPWGNPVLGGDTGDKSNKY